MADQFDNTIHVHADGVCKGNPGLGGWGIVLTRVTESGDRKRLELSGGVKFSTSNKMELTAALKALEVVADKHSEKPVILRTASRYVIQGITEWVDDWRRNGWLTAKKEPIKNAELWELLDFLNTKLNVQWEWVRGDGGGVESHRANQLANGAVNRVINGLEG